MAEIKNSFLKSKMNRDLDDRLIPNGEYRDAMNIQVSTSEGSHVGTAQNILGNIVHHESSFVMPADPVVVGVIGDEKRNLVYWFVYGSDKDCILRKNTDTKILINADNNSKVEDYGFRGDAIEAEAFAYLSARSFNKL